MSLPVNFCRIRRFVTPVVLASILQTCLLYHPCASLVVKKQPGRIMPSAKLLRGESRYPSCTFHYSRAAIIILSGRQVQRNDLSEVNDEDLKGSMNDKKTLTTDPTTHHTFWGRVRKPFISLLERLQLPDDVISLSLSDREHVESTQRLKNPKMLPNSKEEVSHNESHESRWAHAANSIDLSGKWKPIVDSKFKTSYNDYLKNCSQSALFRNVIISALPLTVDIIDQKQVNLTLTSKSPAGSWTRTLVSSGRQLDNSDEDHFEPLHVEIIDPDKDTVYIESWWEGQGTVHRSIMQGKPRVKGGVFETRRYLENEDTLITESLFHPPPHKGSFQPGYVKWRYERVQ